MSRRLASLVLLPALLALATVACRDAPPDPAPSPEVRIDDARVVPAGDVAALYLTIEAPGGDRLLRATSPAGGRLELHETVLEGDMVRMEGRPEGFDLPPDGAFALRPGGPHAMWLERSFEAGESVPVVLHFDIAGAVETSARVEAPGGVPASHAEHAHHGGGASDEGGSAGHDPAHHDAASDDPASDDPAVAGSGGHGP